MQRFTLRLRSKIDRRPRSAFVWRAIVLFLFSDNACDIVAVTANDIKSDAASHIPPFLPPFGGPA
jgi:hypothetical protein